MRNYFYTLPLFIVSTLLAFGVGAVATAVTMPDYSGSLQKSNSPVGVIITNKTGHDITISSISVTSHVSKSACNYSGSSPKEINFSPKFLTIANGTSKPLPQWSSHSDLGGHNCLILGTRCPTHYSSAAPPTAQAVGAFNIYEGNVAGPLIAHATICAAACGNYECEVVQDEKDFYISVTTDPNSRYKTFLDGSKQTLTIYDSAKAGS